MDGDDIDTTNDTEIDLRDRLRFAAGSLAADFSEAVTVALAEELVFNSAEGLLAAASVTDFVPILAERRARQAVRAGVVAPARKADPDADFPRPADPPADVPAAAPDTPPRVSAPPTDTAPVAAPPANGAAPLLAVPEGDLTRLHEEVERARVRVAEWRADLTRR
jgi:hypothetical protein